MNRTLDLTATHRLIADRIARVEDYSFGGGFESRVLNRAEELLDFDETNRLFADIEFWTFVTGRSDEHQMMLLLSSSWFWRRTADHRDDLVRAVEAAVEDRRFL